MGTRRMIGGAVGALVGVGVAVWLGIAFAAPWQGVVFGAFLLGVVGVRIGSLTRPSIRESQLLMPIGSVLGAIGGVFLGIYLVHGFPPRGAFGWRVIACSAALALLGLVLPVLVLSKLIPARCPRCGGPAYLGTDSTFFRKVLAQYHYRCRSCGHTAPADFRQPQG